MTLKTIIKCGNCSEEFSKYPSQLKNGRGQFCSNKCAGEFKRKGAILHCSMCDKEFFRGFWEQSDNNPFCSRQCYDDWRTESSKDTKTYLKREGTHVHRIVAASVLNRSLLKGEIVHHIDENHRNNTPENLAVFPNQSIHARCHNGVMLPAELDKYRILNLREL